MTTLAFEDLRRANIARLPQFKNSLGAPAHDQADGSDWSLLEWSGAMCGEAGEASNIAKKVRRGDLTEEQAREAYGKELADVVCYADICATRAGISLGDAVVQKFNEVSSRIGVDVFIEPTALRLSSELVSDCQDQVALRGAELEKLREYALAAVSERDDAKEALDNAREALFDARSQRDVALSNETGARAEVKNLRRVLAERDARIAALEREHSDHVADVATFKAQAKDELARAVKLEAELAAARKTAADALESARVATTSRAMLDGLLTELAAFVAPNGYSRVIFIADAYRAWLHDLPPPPSINLGTT